MAPYAQKVISTLDGAWESNPDAPVGFKELRLSFDISFETEASEEQIKRLGKLTERYCVVLQTITKKPDLKVRVRSAFESEDGIERAELWGRRYRALRRR
jgi:hypothetical protein